MKTTTLLPYLLGLFLLSSCYYEEVEEPEAEPTACLVTKITNTGTDKAGNATLTYDAQNRIVGAKLVGDQMIEGEAEGNLIVEYNDSLPSRGIIKHPTNGFTFGYIKYGYDDQKRIDSLTIDVPLLDMLSRKTYSYNSGNKISKENEFYYTYDNSGNVISGGFRQYSTFTYDAAGNIVQKKVYKGSSPEAATFSYQVDYTYDNTANPAEKFERLLSGYSTPNNILTAVQTDSKGVINKDYSYSVLYTYNTEGRLSETTSTTQNNAVSKMIMQYSCD